LQILEFNLGPSHPFLATLLNIMADFYLQLGKNKEALVLLKTAMSLKGEKD
jgi:hypothetical protein